MSLFDQNILEKSNEWATDQLYSKSGQLCTVCLTPSWITSQINGRSYFTVYSLYREYNMLMRDKEIMISRKYFIELVINNCPEKVFYKNTYYYSWDWFLDNFIRQNFYERIF